MTPDWIAKAIMNKNIDNRGTVISDFRILYGNMLIKTIWSVKKTNM